MGDLDHEEEELFSCFDILRTVIETRVDGSSEQITHYDELRNSGHDLGDFIFSRGGKGIAVVPVVINDTGPLGPDTDTTGPASDLATTVTTNNGKSDNDAIKALLALYAQAYNYRDAA